VNSSISLAISLVSRVSTPYCSLFTRYVEIILDIRTNYFHIDVYGGKIDPLRLSTVSGAGIISSVEGIQLGETASLMFKLKGDILSRDLVLNGESSDFYVNLRTKETLESEESERERIKQELEEQRKKWMIDTIVLDAGHGGKDPGAIGYSKVKEKDLVLPITLQLGKIIENEISKNSEEMEFYQKARTLSEDYLFFSKWESIIPIFRPNEYWITVVLFLAEAYASGAAYSFEAVFDKRSKKLIHKSDGFGSVLDKQK